MSRITRRDFLKQLGVLSIAGIVAPSRFFHPFYHLTFLQDPFKIRDRGPGLLGQNGTDGREAPTAIIARAFQTPHHALALDFGADEYQAFFDRLVGQGYRSIWVQVTGTVNEYARISGIFLRDGSTTPWYQWVGMDLATYQTKYDAYKALGYRPISVSGYKQKGDTATRYAAIWRYDPGINYDGLVNGYSSNYQSFVNDEINKGYMPVAVDVYPDNTLMLQVADYISIWAALPAHPFEARHGLSSSDYRNFFLTYYPQGYHIIDVSACQLNGTNSFSAMMVKDSITDTHSYHDALPLDIYNQAMIDARIDYQPNVIEGYGNESTRLFAGAWFRRSRSFNFSGTPAPSLAAFDTTMQSFMQSHHIHSGALAVTRNGSLVLARGYRWDYDPIDSVQPTSLFRIASLTKPITSMAIMRLVQEGRLHLSDKLTSYVNLSALAPPGTMDPRMNTITVQHLLQHTAGWDRDSTFDPMFEDYMVSTMTGASLPVSKTNIMQFMTGYSLDFNPGTKVVYSNYGYLLLGRIIENITGMSYAQYVQQAIFNPLHISRMRLGATKFEARQPDEVSYYTNDLYQYMNVMEAGAPTNAMLAYGGFNLENMDSHGGWLASAVDLARFSTAFDAVLGYPIINQNIIDQIFAMSPTGAFPNGSWYGLGWNIRNEGGGITTQHDGSLPGSFTFMRRRFDGVNFVVLFNQRDDADHPDGGYGPPDLSNANAPMTDNIVDNLNNTINSIAPSAWPTGDEFPSYGLPGHVFYLPVVSR